MLANFYNNIDEIIKLLIDEQVEDTELVESKYTKYAENLIISKLKYKGKPLLMLINDGKSIILYTYGK